MVNEETGRPYREDNFQHVFAKLRENAELSGNLCFADLRRSGMNEGGDAGATEDELRGQSGHADRNVVSVYVRSTPRQAGNAIAKRVAARDRTFWKLLSK